MLDIMTFSYFFDFRCIGFCSTGFELFFRARKSYVLHFVAEKKYMHLHFVVVHPMHSALYLPKPSAQLLPPYLNPDAYVMLI